MRLLGTGGVRRGAKSTRRPPFRASGPLTHRFTRVRYALLPLLRLFTLHCTRRRSAAEGEGAQQAIRRGLPRTGAAGQEPRGTTAPRDSPGNPPDSPTFQRERPTGPTPRTRETHSDTSITIFPCAAERHRAPGGRCSPVFAPDCAARGLDSGRARGYTVHMFDLRGAPAPPAPAGAGDGCAADRPAGLDDVVDGVGPVDTAGLADADDTADLDGVVEAGAGECAGRLAAMAPGGALAEVVERVMSHLLAPTAPRPQDLGERSGATGADPALGVEAFGGGPCAPGPDGWVQSIFDPVRAAAPDDGLFQAMAGGTPNPGERALLEAAGAAEPVVTVEPAEWGVAAEAEERAEKTEATAAESEDLLRRGGEATRADVAAAADGAEAPDGAEASEIADAPETADELEVAEALEAPDPVQGVSSMTGRAGGTSWMMPVALEVAEGAGAALPRSCSAGRAAAASADGADISMTRIGLTVLKVCTGRRRTRRPARAASEGAVALRGLDEGRLGTAAPDLAAPAESAPLDALAADWLIGRSGRTWRAAPGGPTWRPPRPGAVADSWGSVVMRCDSFWLGCSLWCDGGRPGIAATGDRAGASAGRGRTSSDSPPCPRRTTASSEYRRPARQRRKQPHRRHLRRE